ncbi:hypothetical protein [Acidithiobacillus sp. HP-11]|nr:hypothetical protein [Acidithiobacillus sp. HP-11]MBE7567994.1 hypothetical protein [Acidithiobacillus sp. HP-11]
MADRYERFGKRLEIAASTQGSVVRKAFFSLAQQIEAFVEETRKELRNWVNESLDLMNRQLELFAAQSKEKMAALEAIVDSSTNIQPRIQSLSQQRQGKESNLTMLNETYAALCDLMDIVPDFGLRKNSNEEFSI